MHMLKAVLLLCASSAHALVVLQRPLPVAAATPTPRAAALVMNDNPFAALGRIPVPALAASTLGAVLVAGAALVSSTTGPADALPYAAAALALLKAGEVLLGDDAA